jgi:hypothetical protein
MDALNGFFQSMWSMYDSQCFDKGLLSAYKNSSARAALLSGDLNNLIKECMPNDWWHEDSSVRESAVARMIGVQLVGAFPTSNVQDPEVFVNQLIEDVLSWEPHFISLERACRELRRTQKFMPAIAEVRAAYDEADRKFTEGCDALDAESIYQTLVNLIALQEKGRLIRSGCRVRHPDFGVGTVDVIEGKYDYHVQFDGQERRKVRLSQIEKLADGDEGFEPPLPAIEHKPSPPTALSWATPASDPVPGSPLRRGKE